MFNNYDGTKPFADVVRQAQAEGYTEPDPRLDLGGTDVMRKIMILAREAGQKIEMEEMQIPAQSEKLVLPSIKEIVKENNALEYSLEHCIEWFNQVEQSWSKPSYLDGRLYKCDHQCGH